MRRGFKIRRENLTNCHQCQADHCLLQHSTRAKTDNYKKNSVDNTQSGLPVTLRLSLRRHFTWRSSHVSLNKTAQCLPQWARLSFRKAICTSKTNFNSLLSLSFVPRDDALVATSVLPSSCVTWRHARFFSVPGLADSTGLRIGTLDWRKTKAQA